MKDVISCLMSIGDDEEYYQPDPNDPEEPDDEPEDYDD